MTIGVFLTFLGVLLLCIAKGWFVGWALLAGLALFFALGLRRGCPAKAMCTIAIEKAKKSGIVITVMLLVGAITGLWRASGTITYCIHHGMRLITPPLFLLLAFLICAALSYVLGTSFGVASTAGVILMALARFGGVSELITGGTVLSGVFFGDRCSPASSSASLVAAVTGTKLYDNVRKMFATGLPPLLLCFAFHGALSLKNPLQAVDGAMAAAMAEAFALSWLTLVPALLMLLLPLLRVPIRAAMLWSIAAAALVAATVQHMPLGAILRAALFGYRAEGPLEAVLSGGGVWNILSTCFVLVLTGLYSGLLEGIHVLEPLQEHILHMGRRLGRFPAAILTGLGSAMVFCNQSIAIMLSEQLLRPSYRDKTELAIDIENAGVLLSALIPWSIAVTAPLRMLGVGPEALPYAALLWLTPLTYLFTKKHFFPAGSAQPALSPAPQERQDQL